MTPSRSMMPRSMAGAERERQKIRLSSEQEYSKYFCDTGLLLELTTRLIRRTFLRQHLCQQLGFDVAAADHRNRLLRFGQFAPVKQPRSEGNRPAGFGDDPRVGNDPPHRNANLAFSHRDDVMDKSPHVLK